MELIEPHSLLDAREMDRISGTGIIREALFGLSPVHQLDLVDHDSRVQVISFGNDKESVEHPDVRLRIRGSENYNHLVDVCRDDSLAASFARQPSREL